MIPNSAFVCNHKETDPPLSRGRAWRTWGLGRLRQLLDLYIGIPALEHAAQLWFDLDLLYASLLTPIASRNLLLYQSLPTSIPCRHAKVRRRNDDTSVGTAARSITE